MLISMQLSFVGIDNASSTINFCHIIHIYATFLTRRMRSVRWTRSLVVVETSHHTENRLPAWIGSRLYQLDFVR